LWVFRYSSQGRSRSLFFSRDARTVKRQYPGRHALQQLSNDARFVVSEPIGDLPGAWAELPEASYGVVSKGGDQLLPFTLRPPSKARHRACRQQAGSCGQVGRLTAAAWHRRARDRIVHIR
jgi:hypothetical protein